MASAFSKLKKSSKLKAAWKKARKSEGFKPMQSPPGHYKGKLKVEASEIEKGEWAGTPVVRFICTVTEPDEFSGQSNTKDYLFGDDPDQTLETLARDMKFMFPHAKDEIAAADFNDLLEMLEGLAEDTHDVDFEITTYKPKKGKYKGQERPALNIGLVTTSDGSDDDEDEEEEDEDEDEAPKKKTAKKSSKKPAKDEDDDEDDEDDTDDDDDSDDDEEESDDDEDGDDDDEYVPSKGDFVKYGRSKYKVTAVQTKAETVTLKNVKTDTVNKGIGWDKLTPLDDEE